MKTTGNLTILFRENGYEFVWSFDKAKHQLNKYAKRKGIKKIDIYAELATKCHVTEGAVKNWFTYKNGAGDIEQVKIVANYFEIDSEMLLKRIGEDKEMSNSTLQNFINPTMDFRTIQFIGMLNEMYQVNKSHLDKTALG